MARPTKQGIDYFPLDCQFDNNIEMMLIEKGANGMAVMVTIWQMIYSNEGYYIANDKDLHLLIKKKIDVDINEVLECINVCLSRNIFDEKLHTKHKILSSKAIQKRYFDAAKKKKAIKINKIFMLIDVSAYENIIDSYDNFDNVCGNATNVNVEVKEEVNINVEVKNLFESFWNNYPKKVDKKDSEIAWKNLSKTKREAALADSKTRYVGTEKQFIPSPARYLRKEKWTDERIAVADQIKTDAEWLEIGRKTGIEAKPGDSERDYILKIKNAQEKQNE